ncbi:unnamed protein product, partial [Urochloa humidicola]
CLHPVLLCRDGSSCVDASRLRSCEFLGTVGICNVLPLPSSVEEGVQIWLALGSMCSHNASAFCILVHLTVKMFIYECSLSTLLLCTLSAQEGAPEYNMRRFAMQPVKNAVM